MAITTAKFLLLHNDGIKQRQLAITFNLSLTLVESNICDVNKKRKQQLNSKINTVMEQWHSG